MSGRKKTASQKKIKKSDKKASVTDKPTPKAKRSVENNVDNIFDLEEMLDNFLTSMATASMNMQKVLADKKYDDLPMTYTIPEMELNIKLVLSYSDSKIKGLFRKTKSEENQEVMSQITVKLAAVPKLRENSKEVTNAEES